MDSTPELAPPEGGLWVRAIVSHFRPGSAASTLNDSAERPGELVFILVFPRGHPKWESEGILYAKTSLHLIPEYWEQNAKSAQVIEGFADGDGNCGKSENVAKLERGIASLNVGQAIEDTAEEHGRNPNDTLGETTHNMDVGDGDATGASHSANGDESSTGTTAPHNSPNAVPEDVPPSNYHPAPHQPIAVFDAHEGSRNFFHFTGWHTISRVALLAPRSMAVTKMLEQKWTANPRPRHAARDKARPKEAWIADLQREWAVIKLVKLHPGEEGCPLDPPIKWNESAQRSGGGAAR